MITRKLLIHFRTKQAEKPIIYHFVKDYDLIVSIFRAQINPDAAGHMVLEVTGKEKNIMKAIEFAKTSGVVIDPVNKNVLWDEDSCTHCGNCLTHCPSHALHIPDRESMKIVFDEELCIECQACLTNCLYGACKAAF